MTNKEQCGFFGVCPNCALKGDLLVFLQDAAARKTIALVAAIPAPAGEAALAYIALFNQQGHGTPWSTARQLFRELAGLVRLGQITKKNRPARKTTPQIWADAMAAVVANRADLDLPLRHHSYLKGVVYNMADDVVAKAEHKTEKRRREAKHCEDARKPATPEEIAQMEEMKRQAGLKDLLRKVGSGPDIGGEP